MPKPASANEEGSGITTGAERTIPLKPAAPVVSAVGLVGGLPPGLPVPFDQPNEPPLRVEPLQPNQAVPELNASFQVVAVPVQARTITCAFAPPVAVSSVNVYDGVHPASGPIWCSGVVDDCAHAPLSDDGAPAVNGEAVPAAA